MIRSWLISLVAVASVAVVAAAPAQAVILDARFNGTVALQTGTAFTVGSAISGEFTYDTGSNSFVMFTIGGLPIASGYASSAALTPDRQTAEYRAQNSAVQQGGSSNTTYIVDLEGLTPFSTSNAVALLTSSGLAANLDTAAGDPGTTTPSTFGYAIGNANGSNTRQVSADLTSITVSTVASVPEPASLALLATAVVGFGVRRRRA